MSAGTVQGKRLLALRLAVVLAISVGSLTTVMAEPAAAQAPCSTRWGVVAAHPDDDIIFMLPNLKNVRSWGICLDITFLTSGDATEPDPFYGFKREQAALADYVKIELGISLSPTANAYQYYTAEPPLDVLQDGIHFVQRYTLTGVTPTIRV